MRRVLTCGIEALNELCRGACRKRAWRRARHLRRGRHGKQYQCEEDIAHESHSSIEQHAGQLRTLLIYLPFISIGYRGGRGNVTMLKRYVMVICAVIAAVTPAAAWPALQEDSAPACKPAGSMMRLAGLPEASGLVASRVTPGRLWAHNDSGKPEIFALDAKGTVTGSVSISGAALEDWEALASGACGNGTCLYIGDIGDNNGKRGEIIIYRVPEPAKAGGSAQVDGVFRASYPDGAHDAEALLAAPDGTLYIVTKGDTGHVALYRFPRELRAGTTMRLERVGAPLSKGEPAAGRANHRRRDFFRRRMGRATDARGADVLSRGRVSQRRLSRSPARGFEVPRRAAGGSGRLRAVEQHGVCRWRRRR